MQSRSKELPATNLGCRRLSKEIDSVGTYLLGCRAACRLGKVSPVLACGKHGHFFKGDHRPANFQLMEEDHLRLKRELNL